MAARTIGKKWPEQGGNERAGKWQGARGKWQVATPIIECMEVKFDQKEGLAHHFILPFPFPSKKYMGS